MADQTVTPIDVRPLGGSLKLNAPVGGPVSLGDVCYIAADGDWERADADVAATARIRGVCVSTPRSGVADAEAGDRCDFVTVGPVTGFSGLTPGNEYFASTNPGKVESAAPGGASADFKFILGTALTAVSIFVFPYTDDPAAQ